MTEHYCGRCALTYEIARNEGKLVNIVLPPHNPSCPKIRAPRPRPLRAPDRFLRDR